MFRPKALVKKSVSSQSRRMRVTLGALFRPLGRPPLSAPRRRGNCAARAAPQRQRRCPRLRRPKLMNHMDRAPQVAASFLHWTLSVGNPMIPARGAMANSG